MKSFKISCYDKEKNLVGEQTVSMSSRDVDMHKISFVGKNNTVPFVIDIENNELIIDNSNGEFDEITQEKPIAKIKVSNIQLDYEENITFNLDSTNTSYRISGNSFEKKQGSTYTPVKTYENVFDIVLPSTLFADINSGKLNTNGFPFQMFDSITEQDKTELGIETYQSSSKLLNIIKYNNQVYIGRGKKLIPVNIDNQNYYKIGNDSVFGLTIGRNNGVSGKQSQGIAFKMPEAELENVATFLNGGLDRVTFKSQDDFNSNDIDYIRVNKQSDLNKITNPNSTTTIIDPEPPKTDEDPKPKPTEKKEDKKDDQKEDKKEKPEKIEAGLGYLFGALAFITALLLVSGIIFGPLAWILFGLFVAGATINPIISGYHYNKTKLSKEEKLQKKIQQKQKTLEKLKNKKPTKRNIAKQNKCQSQLNKLQNKANNTTGDNKIVNSETQVSENNTEIKPSTDETVIDTEMTKPKGDTVVENVSTTTPPQSNIQTNNMQRSTIHTTLDSMIKNKPTNMDERATMLANINSQVMAACPDGTDVASIPEADRGFYTDCVNFRTAYIAEQSAKQTHEEALARGDATEILVTELAWQDARNNVNTQLNNLYNSTTVKAPTTPVVQADAGRNP